MKWWWALVSVPSSLAFHVTAFALVVSVFGSRAAPGPFLVDLGDAVVEAPIPDRPSPPRDGNGAQPRAATTTTKSTRASARALSAARVADEARPPASPGPAREAVGGDDVPPPPSSPAPLSAAPGSAPSSLAPSAPAAPVESPAAAATASVARGDRAETTRDEPTVASAAGPGAASPLAAERSGSAFAAGGAAGQSVGVSPSHEDGGASGAGGAAGSDHTGSVRGTSAGGGTPGGRGTDGEAALTVPGAGEGTSGEYARYLALVRRRIQESLTYPPAARRRGAAGTVRIEIVLRPDGTVSEVTLLSSSSHHLLDEAALEAARSLPRLPFPPDLAPRALRVRLPVVFELR